MLGQLIKNVRAGKDKVICFCKEVASAPETITLTSDAFAHGSDIPIQFTQAGRDLSPPLMWHNVPSNARSLVLVVEDPDAPLPFAFVHAIAYNLPPQAFLPEGAIANTPPARSQPQSDGLRIGKNTVGATAYRGRVRSPVTARTHITSRSLHSTANSPSPRRQGEETCWLP